MSLINDALKRAKAAQQPTQPAPKLEFRVVTDPVPSGSYGSRVLLVAIIGLFVMLGLVVLRMNGRTSPPLITANASAPPAAVAAVQPADTAPPSVPAAETPPAASAPSPARPAAAPAETPLAPAVTNVENQATNTPPAAEPAPPKPPAPKVQAIVFNPTRPSAMINGRTVFVGDKVAGAKVLGIDQDSVTLVAAGQTNVLTLEQ